ncbi:MAG: ATP-binding protein [bacterium]|nr:ATP-binding protein [bacterium]
MRYFYESAKNLYVIGAGSLLETMIGKDQISFPVGRVRYMFMYPMTFEEFLLAKSEQEALKLFSRVPLPEFAFAKLLKLFHTYTLLGGMPEVLNRYVKNKNIVELTPIYQGLITAYMEDVSKYARNSTQVEVIRHAIESAPFEAGSRIKFAGFGKSNYKSREMGEALRTLQRAMLLYLLYPAVVTGPPAATDEKKSPRLQFLDTGLLNYCAGLQGHFFKFDDLHSFIREDWLSILSARSFWLWT